MCALLIAAASPSPELIRVLVRHGADVSLEGPEGLTPLMTASACGHVETVSALLAAGAAPDALDDGGDSALHHAVRHGRFGVVEELLLRGASAAVRNRMGRRPVDLVSATSKGSSSVSREYAAEELRARLAELRIE